MGKEVFGGDEKLRERLRDIAELELNSYREIMVHIVKMYP